MRATVGPRAVERVISMLTANRSTHAAPGGPGSPARWTSSAKTGVGTALSDKSRVWFTLSHGIFNEIYYPRIDQACVRDMGLIVTDGAAFFSEEKRDAASEVHWLADGVPAFGVVNTSRDGRYRIEKQILTDPHRDTVLQQIRFIARQGELSDYRLHVLLAPHLGNQGGDNTAWVEEIEGTPLLLAQRDGSALALACSAPWIKRSVGYVGSSDGWQDLKAHKQMTWEYTRAENGNVALTGQIDLLKSQGAFVLALGFGKDPQAAARNAIGSLRDGFDKAQQDYIAGWQDWIKTHASPKKRAVTPGDLSRRASPFCAPTSPKCARRSHREPRHPVGIQQGRQRSGRLPSRLVTRHGGGGRRLARCRRARGRAPRALLFAEHPAAGRPLVAEHVAGRLALLERNPNGRDGVADSAGGPGPSREGIGEADLAGFWPMVRQAAGYLARNGPVSPQDRWEEDPGYSPFTVAAEIAALLAAADLADLNHEASIATYLREIADVWNTSIERWMYVSGTDWCRQVRASTAITFGSPRSRRVPSGSSLQQGCARQERDGLRGHPPGQSSDQSRRAGAGAFWLARGR